MSMSKAFAKWFARYDRPDSPAVKLRAKRIAPLRKMIESIHETKGSVSIVDLGGTRTYWGILAPEFLRDHHVRITVVNLPGTTMPADDGPFRFVEGDARHLDQFEDEAFDIAHSNSVLEHVGDWDCMKRFAGELRRVAKSYFVQTPNYWFPVEPHCITPFFHWLPKPIRVGLVRNFQLGHWPRALSVDEAVRLVESARLLDREMFRELFGDADILTERYFLLPKSFVAIRDKSVG